VIRRLDGHRTTGCAALILALALIPFAVAAAGKIAGVL
jgi:hypothetical protein